MDHKHIIIAVGSRDAYRGHASSYEGNFLQDGKPCLDIADVRIVIDASSGIIIAEVERIRTVHGGDGTYGEKVMQQVIENGKGVTYIERYILRSLFLEGHRMAEVPASALGSGEIEGAPA